MFIIISCALILALTFQTSCSAAEFQTGNIFAPSDTSVSEFTEILASGHDGPMRIERIVSEGQVSPADFWYDQSEFEWVIVLQGDAELEFMNHGRIKLSSGDWVYIPAHEKHKVTYTSVNPKCVWLAVFGCE